LRLSHSRPKPASGSANLAAKISAPGQGADNTRGTTTFVIAFGPLAAPALSSNEFRLVLDDGSAELEVEGTYSVDSLGRPTLSPDPVQFEAGLRGLIDDVCLGIATPAECAIFPTLGMTIARRDLSIKARMTKSGAEAMKSRGKIDFAFVDAGGPVVRVKLRIRGAGIMRD
jgi:hypothetical protein